MEAKWEQISENRYVFTVRANRFLRNMVRAMVGSLLEVGLGKREPEWIAQVLSPKGARQGRPVGPGKRPVPCRHHLSLFPWNKWNHNHSAGLSYNLNFY